MPFECKKYHCKCEALCCGVVPIPAPIWQRNQHKLQRPVKEIHKVYYAPEYENRRRIAILPVMDDFKCPFLTQDLSCAIYDDRPEVCRKFGDESHQLLKCPMQHKDGTPRDENELVELKTLVDKWVKDR